MMAYVAFGGMLATTGFRSRKPRCFSRQRVNIGTDPVAFRLQPGALQSGRGTAPGQAIMAPGGLVRDPVSAISLGTALIFGAGTARRLMRFFRSRDASGRLSVLVATGFIAFSIRCSCPWVRCNRSFQVILPSGRCRKSYRRDQHGRASPIARWSLLLGFISAVAFATISRSFQVSRSPAHRSSVRSLCKNYSSRTGIGARKCCVKGAAVAISPAASVSLIVWLRISPLLVGRCSPRRAPIFLICSIAWLRTDHEGPSRARSPD